MARGELIFDRSHGGSHRDIVHTRHVPAEIQDGKLKLRLLMDKESIELFVNDGDQIRVFDSDGNSRDLTCRYIDDYHLEVGATSSNLYHITEFAERMERNGSTVIPLRSSLPNYCYSTLPSTGELIRIGRGTYGCTQSDKCNPGETGREAADRLNQKAGVTKARKPPCSPVPCSAGIPPPPIRRTMMSRGRPYLRSIYPKTILNNCYLFCCRRKLQACGGFFTF